MVTDSLHLTAPSLGAHARAALETPALVVDLGRTDAAIHTMGDAMRARGVTLRPHAKTHKSLAVGRRQVEAGAVGLTVGTLGEAEVFAAGGFDDLVIAYPLLPVGAKADRLRSLLDVEGMRLAVGVDSPVGARAVAAAAGSAIGRLRVLVEIDSGGARTGVAPAEAGALAAEAAGLGLAVDGVFTHGGHGYAAPGAEGSAGDDEVAGLALAAYSMAGYGVTRAVISAGSTPTAVRSAHGVVTEERPGSYVFGDRQQATLGSVGPDAVAAVVASTVVSVSPAEGRFVIDAGAKSLGKDVAPYLDGHGEVPELGGAVVRRVFDYHGVVERIDGGPLPAVGDVVLVMPNHICPVVNLVDRFAVAMDGRILDWWAVDARGRNG
jgi:D-serine deaminase-like pyridoxal phosphate-dependent protein